MKITYIASEANPFAASGGLGDVMGSLPAAVLKEGGEGTEVSVIMPLYRSISDAHRKEMKKVFEFRFYLGWRHAYCGVFETYKDGVRYLFLDNEYYFYRDHLYGDFDDGERFAYFCRAAIEYISQSGDIPDVLHANDWQSALSVVYLKTIHKDDSRLSGIKTVFTIHNIEYQGKYDLRILSDIFDLDEYFAPVVEYDGAINLLKGGVVAADAVTTVSPRYAEELHDPAFSFGLSPIIDLYSEKTCGIINGIDTSYFDPSNEEGGIIPFTARGYKKGKTENKLALQRALGLPERADVPMIAMITRLTHGKGVDLVLHVFEELLEEDVQFVLLGTGDESYERIFSMLCDRHADKARAILKFDRTLSKQIYASADLFMMPSKSEPCGLAQMIACRYGTLPIVRNVGGLHDSIEDGVNGFVFDNFNAHELLFKTKDALSLWRKPEERRKLVQGAMKSDFTWARSARKNIELYASLISR